MFADDTCLVFRGHNLDELVHRVNLQLRKVSDWCYFNKLCLNPAKCSFMLVTTKNVDIVPKIFIGNSEIACVREYKYLGVYIDFSLKFQR